MANRQANCATNLLDKKFELDTDTFVVVTNFNGYLLIHIRKYSGNFLTKEGSACSLTNIINYWGCYRRKRKEHSTWDRCAYEKPNVQ